MIKDGQVLDSFLYALAEATASVKIMAFDITALERSLGSDKKEVRLRALKQMLLHPDATPLQLVRCLCSSDNRNFEFLHVFELDTAMRQAWARLRGVTDHEVYEFLASFYAEDPVQNKNLVIHILELLATPQAQTQLERLRQI